METHRKDIESGRVSGFGTTVNIINGGIECGLEKHYQKPNTDMNTISISVNILV